MAGGQPVDPRPRRISVKCPQFLCLDHVTVSLPPEKNAYVQEKARPKRSGTHYLAAPGDNRTVNDDRDHSIIWGATDMSYKCSRCSSDTEEGFLLEKGDGAMLSSQTWVAGKANKSLFSGLSLRGHTVYDVMTFRCVKCGYLDSYALSKQ